MEEEEKEEHTKDGMNNKLVNPMVDDGARRNGGCGRHCAIAVATIAALAVRSGHVVSADLVQAYHSTDVGSNKPTGVKLRCRPHHLIDIVDPPVVVVVVVVNDAVIPCNTILYSRSKIF